MCGGYGTGLDVFLDKVTINLIIYGALIEDKIGCNV